MRILLSKCDLVSFMSGDANVKLGIGWYRHHPDHKWFGFSIEFYCLVWLLTITFVSNFKEYERRINPSRRTKK